MRYVEAFVLLAAFFLFVVVSFDIQGSESLTGRVNDWFNPKEDIQISINSHPPKDVNDLFTVFVQVPIQDLLPEGIAFKGRDRTDGDPGDITGDITGVCRRRYSVGIGYRNVLGMFDEHLVDACNNRSDKMPVPQILTTNPVYGKVYGDYPQHRCDSFDQAQGEYPRESHRQIETFLKEVGQWENIINRSKMILGGYFRIFCPEVPEDPAVKKMEER